MSARATPQDRTTSTLPLPPQAARDTLLEARHLTRHYGALHVVEDVSFDLARGEVLGLLGPNGAGKSTTLQMITGNLAPSRGEVRIAGVDLLDDPRHAKASLGYLPEYPPLYHDLTVSEYLLYCAHLHGLRRAVATRACARAQMRCGLKDVSLRLIGNLSKGYQQRVGIAQAILHEPAVVILDEPTVGLDPLQIREIRTLIRDLAQDHGVILSTHILPEVQEICDRVQILHRGRLVFSESLATLGQAHDAPCLIVGLHHPPGEAALRALPGVDRIETLLDIATTHPATGNQPSGDTLHATATHWRVYPASDTDPTDVLLEQAVAQGWGLFELRPERRSLEHIFLTIISAEQAAPEQAT